MVFTRENYRLLMGSILLVIVGFTAMRIENEVDGLVSLYLSPVLLFLGYVGVALAILWEPDTDVEA
jgi:hypothetical protein